VSEARLGPRAGQHGRVQLKRARQAGLLVHREQALQRRQRRAGRQVQQRERRRDADAVVGAQGGPCRLRSCAQVTGPSTHRDCLCCCCARKLFLSTPTRRTLTRARARGCARQVAASRTDSTQRGATAGQGARFCRTGSERSSGWVVASATGAPPAWSCQGRGRCTISQAPSWLRRSVSPSVKKSCCTSLFFSVTMSRCPCGARQCHSFHRDPSYTKCAATCKQRLPRRAPRTCITTGGAASPPPLPGRKTTRLPTSSWRHFSPRCSAKSLTHCRTLQQAQLFQVPAACACRAHEQSRAAIVQEGDACRQCAPFLVLARPRYLRELGKELPQSRRLEPSDCRRADRHAWALLQQRCGRDTAAVG